MADPDILYHGTCRAKWDLIRAEGALRPAPYGGEPHVSLTDDPNVAGYFARLAVEVEREISESDPLILAASRRDLEEAGFHPAPFVSSFWDDGISGGCAWEREVVLDVPVPSDFFHPVDLPDMDFDLSREEIIALQDRFETEDPSP